MRLWFTGDMLFGHKLAARKRGFDVVTDHDDTIINGWRECVRAVDEVWVLGNITMNEPEYALDIISDLPGTKFLVPGPYDACHPMHTDAHRHMARYRRSFEEILPYHRRRIRGQNVLVSHLPYERGPDGLPKHQQFRLRDYGQFIVHAHTQQRGRLMNCGRDIYVGIDAWDFRPAPIEEVSRLIGDTLEKRTEDRERLRNGETVWDRMVRRG